MKKGTKGVWAGEEKTFFKNSTQVPVVHSVAFGYETLDEWMDVVLEKKEGYIYSRNTNPTVKVFEEKMAVLEGTEAAVSFSTGMGAISNTLFALLRPGDRVVTQKDTYGGTSKLFLKYLPDFGIEVKLCETGDHELMEKEINKGCRLVYLETPTNPTLKVVDLERLAKAAKKVGAIVVTDNTFSTPFNTNPAEFGVDLIIHSATKFLSGHADALGGIVCGTEENIRTINAYREIHGDSLHPMAAYFIIRGIKTLHLRIKQQNSSAMEIASFLKTLPAIGEVHYPGLAGHKNHNIAKKQMKGFGGILSFSVKEGSGRMKEILEKLKIAKLAANLGAVETIAGIPATTSHVECSIEEREELGIPEGLIRYSVGIEETEDLINDLKQAISK